MKRTIVIACNESVPHMKEWLEKYVPEEHNLILLDGGSLRPELVAAQTISSDATRVVLINHQQCGHYGQGQVGLNHFMSIGDAGKRLQQAHPGIKVEGYWLRLDGSHAVVDIEAGRLAG
jgi:hypothetical protein